MTHTEDIIVLDDKDDNKSNGNEAIEEKAAVSKKMGIGDSGQSVYNTLGVKTLCQGAILLKM